MPADSRDTLKRLWEILKALPRYPAMVTASEIESRLKACGFEMGKRTIERNLENLSSTFPLYCDNRSKPYGWAWAKDAPAFSLPGLTESEALSMCLVERHLSDLLPASTLAFLQGHFREARRKLENPAVPVVRRNWLDKVRVLPPTQPRLPPVIDPDVQEAIYKALLGEEEIKIRYRHRGSADAPGYLIWPLAIVQRGQVVHVVARLPREGIVRRFALNRIIRAELQGRKFDYPDDFNPDQWLDEGNLGFGGTGKKRVTLEFASEAGEAIIERPLAKDQEVEALPEGKIRIIATLAINRQLVWWLLGYGNQVKVIAPDILMKIIATEAEAVVRKYME